MTEVIDQELIEGLMSKYATKEELTSALKEVGSKQPMQSAEALEIMRGHTCEDQECELTKYKQAIEEDGIAIGLLLDDLI